LGSFRPPTPPVVSNTAAPASIAPSDAPTLKMSNGFAQKSNDNKAATKWLQHVQRRDASRHAQTVADSLCPMTANLSLSLRQLAEPPPPVT
jgi:hypothetical protein